MAVSSDQAITAVVCSRDGGELLGSTLAGIRQALGPADNGLVVDSASTTDAVVHAAETAEIECLRLAEPGLSRARNAGLRHAACGIVAFTDDDCRPDSRWLEQLRHHFADPRVAFVTGRVAPSRALRTGASVLDRPEAVRYSGAQDPYGIGHGANMAFRRDVLLELGGFDELLGAGSELRSAEDADMLYRCLAHGWSGVYEPAAVVTHEQWRSEREIVTLRYGYGLGNGAIRIKEARREPAVGLPLLVESFWGQGLAPTLRAVRHRRLSALPGALTWTAGMCVGMARGLFLRLGEHNFVGGRS
jgi:GT2 family glycosyltransferase